MGKGEKNNVQRFRSTRSNELSFINRVTMYSNLKKKTKLFDSDSMELEAFAQLPVWYMHRIVSSNVRHETEILIPL